MGRDGLKPISEDGPQSSTRYPAGDHGTCESAGMQGAAGCKLGLTLRRRPIQSSFELASSNTVRNLLFIELFNNQI